MMTSCENALSVQVRFPAINQVIASGSICRSWPRSRLLRKLTDTRLSLLSILEQDRAGALLRRAGNGSGRYRNGAAKRPSLLLGATGGIFFNGPRGSGSGHADAPGGLTSATRVISRWISYSR